MIYFVVVNYYSSTLIQKLIASIPEANSHKYRVIIVNNSPDDQNIHQLSSGKIEVLNNTDNNGFGAGCNLGIKYIATQDRESIIWLLNPDAYFPANNPTNYWEVIEKIWQRWPEISIMGTLIKTPSHDLWFARGTFNASIGRVKGLSHLDGNLKPNEMFPSDWVSGCSLMINLKNFPQIPYFDESFFLYYEDVDFCLRYQRLNHQIALYSGLQVIHQESSITNKNQYQKIFHSSFSYFYFLQKYTSKLVFLLCLTKFIFNIILNLFSNREVSRAKYDGLISFMNKVVFKRM